MDKIRVLIAKPGLDGHDRGALVITQALRDAGMEVIYTGLRKTPKQIVQAAIQEDVDIIGLSSLSGAHNLLFPEIIKLLKEENAEDILVVGGGVIPKEDIQALEAAGVQKIFTPGTTTESIASFIKSTVLHSKKRKNTTLPQGVDHIGIAVKSIEAALSFYVKYLHLEVEKIVEVPKQKAKVAFLPIGNVTLELLEPLSSDSPIAKFLEKRGEGLHHLAFSVSNLQERLDQLNKNGIKLIDETPHIGAGGYPIAFLHPTNSNGVLIELCETENRKGE